MQGRQPIFSNSSLGDPASTRNMIKYFVKPDAYPMLLVLEVVGVRNLNQIDLHYCYRPLNNRKVLEFHLLYFHDNPPDLEGDVLYGIEL